MTRVADALKRFAPRTIDVSTFGGLKREMIGVEFVPASEADVVVLHVIGFPETVAAIASIKARGQKYVMIQYCLRTTQEPSTEKWLPLWKDALFVWSYYDLQALCLEDGTSPEFAFFHAPMGVDPKVFRLPAVEERRRWTTLTSGYLAGPESVGEVVAANRALNTWVYHLGPDLRLGYSQMSSVKDIPDATLIEVLQATKYVSGLRRSEGFEMIALEGLLCGARPILYDKPHYRQWYGDHAEYVPEESPDAVALAVQEVLRQEPRPVTPKEWQTVADFFDWARIYAGFFDMLQAEPAEQDYAEPVKTVEQAVTVVDRGRKLLWIGDAGVSTGFALSTHKILETLRQKWDVTVLGLNYLGQPHRYPYDIHPCIAPFGESADPFGIHRTASLVSELRPDVVIVQNDPWNFPRYLQAIGNTPTIGIVAVDGKNCNGVALNGLRTAIFWTKFGAIEAAKGGYRGLSAIVPLGVDLNVFKPMDRNIARTVVGIPDSVAEAYIVGNINRNQPRKRLDLTVQYFCEWIRSRNITDAYLYLHVAPTGDAGYNVRQLMAYYGCANRLIRKEPPIGLGSPTDLVAATYNCFDVQMSTSQGEGFGLTTFEGMACGIPQVVGEWAAYAELLPGAAALIPCPTTIATPSNINTIGGIPDREMFIQALDELYRSADLRQNLRERGLALVAGDRFRWENIGNAVHQVLLESLDLVPLRRPA